MWPLTRNKPKKTTLAHSQTFETHWGARFTNNAGKLFADLPKLASVGLHDLGDVRSHDIVRVAGSTSHTVHFHDGGLLQFAYNDRGQLIAFSGARITISADKDGHVMVAAGSSPVSMP